MSIRTFLLFFIGLSIIAVLGGCSELPPAETPQDGDPPLSAGVQEVHGVVLSGGDQTAEGLLDTPRTFAYKVQLDSGEIITVTYTAFPPRPVGETEPAPRLEFQDGMINPGDRLSARGTYDPETTTLTVEAETDFIETFSE